MYMKYRFNSRIQKAVTSWQVIFTGMFPYDTLGMKYWVLLLLSFIVVDFVHPIMITRERWHLRKMNQRAINRTTALVCSAGNPTFSQNLSNSVLCDNPEHATDIKHLLPSVPLLEIFGLSKAKAPLWGWGTEAKNGRCSTRCGEKLFTCWLHQTTKRGDLPQGLIFWNFIRFKLMKTDEILRPRDEIQNLCWTWNICQAKESLSFHLISPRACDSKKSFFFFFPTLFWRASKLENLLFWLKHTFRSWR